MFVNRQYIPALKAKRLSSRTRGTSLHRISNSPQPCFVSLMPPWSPLVRSPPTCRARVNKPFLNIGLPTGMPLTPTGQGGRQRDVVERSRLMPSSPIHFDPSLAGNDNNKQQVAPPATACFDLDDPLLAKLGFVELWEIGEAMSNGNPEKAAWLCRLAVARVKAGLNPKGLEA